MVYFKTGFFGYSRRPVDEHVNQLEKRLEETNRRNREQEDTIRELKDTVRSFQQRQGLISDVMMDARLMSKSILSETQENAQEKAQAILEEAEERIAQMEETIRHYQELERRFTQFEQTMKSELRKQLEGYLLQIDSLTFPESQKMKKEIVEEIQQVSREMELTKNIVTFPKAQPQKIGGDIPVYVVQ
ncbi:DivIVA domain-containing protein [Streptococcus sp. ZY1909104]|uniref:DivIVA domain-containing protein n=1 Tax=Streptococcus TaxID=1301 RepID=UPI0014789D5A